jgi:hypothetical protein
VVFADQFTDWITGSDNRYRLELIDLIEMIKEFSWLKIKVIRRRTSHVVTVHSGLSEVVGFSEHVVIRG